MLMTGLLFIFHYYQSMYHHNILCLLLITGLVEEDTMSRLSSCPSPTMIGALHGRDVVLRFVSSSSPCFLHHLHVKPTSCQQKLDQEFAVKRRSSWPFVGAHQVDGSHDGGCRRFCFNIAEIIFVAVKMAGFVGFRFPYNSSDSVGRGRRPW